MPTECEYSECSNIIDDAAHGNRKFCSLTCRRKNTAKYEWADRERICRGCGIPFKADSPNQRYCERTCTRKHENEKRRMTSVDLNEPLSGRDEQGEDITLVFSAFEFLSWIGKDEIKYIKQQTIKHIKEL